MKPKIKIGDPIPLLDEPCKPVFLVGMNGSGTSMLADCLGQHPELFASYKETRVIPYFIQNIDKFGDLNIDSNFLKLWEEVLDIDAFQPMNDWVSLSLPENWKQFPRDLQSVIDAAFRSISLARGKQRWAEKTPQHVQHITSLSEVFPGAKFIHIIRDGRDCAASFHRRWRRTPAHTVYRWKHVLREGCSQGAKLDEKYFQLKYEDLTAEPDLWMKKICEFAEMPFDDSVLRSNQPYSSNSSSTTGVIYSNSGNWKKYFNQRQLKYLERIAGKSLQKYGYEVVFSKGDEDPSAVLLDFWKWKDAIHKLFFVSANKIFGRYRKVPWSVLFRQAMTALKQRKTNKY